MRLGEFDPIIQIDSILMFTIVGLALGSANCAPEFE
jgi:hypothetical protein